MAGRHAPRCLRNLNHVLMDHAQCTVKCLPFLNGPLAPSHAVWATNIVHGLLQSMLCTEVTCARYCKSLVCVTYMTARPTVLSVLLVLGLHAADLVVQGTRNVSGRLQSMFFQVANVAHHLVSSKCATYMHAQWTAL